MLRAIARSSGNCGGNSDASEPASGRDSDTDILPIPRPRGMGFFFRLFRADAGDWKAAAARLELPQGSSGVTAVSLSASRILSVCKVLFDNHSRAGHTQSTLVFKKGPSPSCVRRLVALHTRSAPYSLQKI